MKFNSIFQHHLNCADQYEVFEYFQKTLTDSITLWNYFVDWQKVLTNIQNIEIHLNTINYLVGKDDIENEFRKLLQQCPQVISAIPILIASHDHRFKILNDDYSNGKFNYKDFSFKIGGSISLSESDINDVLEFTKKTGILELFKDSNIRSIPDYVLGIEVGLDTNARKNRSGNTMEKILESSISVICEQNNFAFITQATSEKIKSQWNINVEVDKAKRRFDFAVKNQNNLYLIETNFYGGGGSKLKATAGEYKSLFDLISKQGYTFIWVTDGSGWRKTRHPLEETFLYIDYTLNLNMVGSGLLEALIQKNL